MLGKTRWDAFKAKMTTKYGHNWTSKTLTREEYATGLLILNDVSEVVSPSAWGGGVNEKVSYQSHIPR